MRHKTPDAFGGNPTPEQVKSIIEEVGPEGWIKIKLHDNPKPVNHPVVQIGSVDDGGLEITTVGQESFLQWDNIEWVRPCDTGEDNM